MKKAMLIVSVLLVFFSLSQSHGEIRQQNPRFLVQTTRNSITVFNLDNVRINNGMFIIVNGHTPNVVVLSLTKKTMQDFRIHISGKRQTLNMYLVKRLPEDYDVFERNRILKEEVY